MKTFIGCLLFAALFGIMFSLSHAQLNQSTQKPNPEIETLKIQLQAMENEKIELTAKLLDAQAKLAEANVKLINAEFGKLERELRDSNDGWLMKWNAFFLGVLAVIGIALWFSVKSLIADRVEKSLNGFKKAVDQVNTLKNELRILRKEQAASLLETTFQPDFGSELGYPKENEARREETLKELSEETLLDVFGDKKYLLAVRHKAAEIMTQKSPPLVGPLLELLNSAIDPDSDIVAEIEQNRLRNSAAVLGRIETPETYEGLTKFLNRLLTENPKHKDLFLKWTVFSLAYLSIKLNNRESAFILRRSIPYLDVKIQDDQALKDLAEYFHRFNELEGIKEILTNGLTNRMPEVESKCLELLQKHDPDFVRDWKAQKETANTENEDSS